MFVCFFAKDYNPSTIIKRLLQRLYHHTQYIETKKQHHSTYSTVTEYKLTLFKHMNTAKNRSVHNIKIQHRWAE